MCQLGGAVAGATAKVQRTLARCQQGCQRVPREVFVFGEFPECARHIALVHERLECAAFAVSEQAHVGHFVVIEGVRFIGIAAEPRDPHGDNALHRDFFEEQTAEQLVQGVCRVKNEVGRWVPVGPLRRGLNGVVAARVGRADDYKGVWANGIAPEQREKEMIGVCQMLYQLKHQNQIKPFGQQVFGALDNGHAIAVTLLNHASGVCRGFYAEALPALVCRNFEVAAIAAANIQHAKISLVTGKAAE